MNQIIDNEIWEPIKKYPNYCVSNIGRIMSIKFNIILICNPRKDGYKRIQLTNNGIRKKYYVHRLVAEHFIKNENNKLFVNHKDGDKANNHVSNLEWVTPSENSIHARDVLHVQQVGSTHYMTKFTEDDIIAIHNMRKRGITLKEIGKVYGVGLSTIGKIVTGVNWKQVKVS